MAIALAWRIAIRLAPPAGAALVRLLKWAEGPGLPNAVELLDRLRDPAESDADLTIALSEARGYPSEVATYTGAFEVRRVQLNFVTASASLLDEDVRVCTFHLIKLSGATPVDTWDGADFAAAEGLFVAFWNTVNSMYLSTTSLTAIKFYREGPAIVPPQPPVRDWAGADIPGDVSPGVSMLPPQIGMSVTEKTSIRRSWGRFYLPSPVVNGSDGVGRIVDAWCTSIADAADTLYQGLKTNNIPAVVYRRALPEREDADGDTIAAREASALSVDQLQVDNLFDVVRSRRYDRPSLRVQRDIT